MKRKLNTGINFSGLQPKICLKKITAKEVIIRQFGGN